MACRAKTHPHIYHTNEKGASLSIEFLDRLARSLVPFHLDAILIAEHPNHGFLFQEIPDAIF